MTHCATAAAPNVRRALLRREDCDAYLQQLVASRKLESTRLTVYQTKIVGGLYGGIK